MKTKFILAFVMMSLAMAASAQIQLLYLDGGRDVIDRNKKLYWMNGDDDPCFDILNYKKTGNKETFTLRGKEDIGNGQHDIYSVVMTLDAKTQVPIEITLDNKEYKINSKVKTSSGDAREDERVIQYFKGLAGYSKESTPAVKGTSVPAAASKVEEAKPEEETSKDAGEKIKDKAKDAIGKVKGVFKKKK